MFKIDVTAEMIVGDRDHQEDCLAYHVSEDEKSAFVVLADGLGGHNCGDIASGIVVKTMLDYVVQHVFEQDLPPETVHLRLKEAATKANTRLARYQQKHPEAHGMGTTLVCALAQGGRLFWISIGDSPLYLYKSGEVHRLNADHSVAEILRRRVAAGKMDPVAAANDPRRSQLTSAIAGQKVTQIDQNMIDLSECKDCIFVVASDGILSTTPAQIGATLGAIDHSVHGSGVKALMGGVVAQRVAEQDNTSIALMRVSAASA